MDSDSIVGVILILAVVVFFVTGIKVVQETERLALFIGGRFAKLQRPGISIFAA